MLVNLQSQSAVVLQKSAAKKELQTKLQNIAMPAFMGMQELSLNVLKANFMPVSFNGSVSPGKNNLDITLDKAFVGIKKDLNIDRIFSVFEKPLTTAINRVYDERNKDGEWLKWIDMPGQKLADVQKITDFVDNKVRNKFDDVVILGIGGSSLGAKAVISALADSKWNSLTAEKRNGLPKIHFIENIDPDTFNETLTQLDMTKTLITVVSKSGKTPETSATFLNLQEKMEEAVGPDKLKNHIVAITDKDPEKSILKKVSDQKGYETFIVPDDVGGRYSVLSDVGLLPAAMAGIDIKALLLGAEDMSEACKNTTDLKNNPAANQALAHFVNYRQDRPYSVLIPYADKLSLVSDWYAQLWAESLGKKENASGKTVHLNHSPVKALGAIDQHSQLQLWREGKNDKVITVLTVNQFDNEVPITKNPDNIPEDLKYMRHNTLNELMREEANATKEVLIKDRKPVVGMEIHKIDAYNLGQLLQMFMLQTAILGELQGLGVNTYLQPAVEEGKNIATSQLAKMSEAKIQ